MFRRSNRSYRYKPLRGKKAMASKASYVKSVARKVAKAVISNKAEHKYLDYLHTMGDITSSWQEDFVTGVPQNDTDNGRSGDQIAPSSLELRGYVRNVAGTFDYSAICRVIVFQWHPSVSSVTGLIASDVMEGTAPSVVDYVSQFYSVDNRKLFTILKDVTFPIDYSGGPSGHVMHWKIPLKQKIQYLSASTTGAVSTNQIRVAYVCTTAGTNRTQIEFRTRLRYTDM